MDDKNKYMMQYKRTYKELLIECENLKKLLDTVDPMDIDFYSKIRTIDNLKRRLNELHLYCMDEI